jgi:hypothetical protein
MNSSFQNGTVVLVHGAWADGSCWRKHHFAVATSRSHGNVRADSPHLPHG